MARHRYFWRSIQTGGKEWATVATRYNGTGLSQTGRIACYGRVRSAYPDNLTVVFIHTFSRENTFKLPARVTLAGDKRVQWYADLANSDVPLQKLAKNVPHGKKDQDLLEFLFTNKTPVDRAVWYIRCLGAIEIVREILRIFVCRISYHT